MVYFFASQPVTADSCAGYVLIGRNYNLGQPAQVLHRAAHVVLLDERDLTTGDDEALTGDVLRLLGAEVDDPGGHVVGVPCVEAFRLRDVAERAFRHPRARARRDGVRRDTVLRHLLRDAERERDETGLREVVVRLPGVAEQTRLRRRMDQTAVNRLARLLRLVPPVHARELGRREVPLAVDGDDRVPLGLFHVEGHAVAEDPGVVDEDVQIAERLDGLIDHVLGALEVCDVVEVRRGFAAHRLDLVDDLRRGTVVLTRAVVFAAEVVDDDLRALAREFERVAAADTPPGSGDDRNFSIQKSHTASRSLDAGEPREDADYRYRRECDTRSGTCPTRATERLRGRAAATPDGVARCFVRSDRVDHPTHALVQPIGRLAQLDLRQADDVDQDQHHPHEQQPEAAEPTRDHVRELPRLEVLPSGLEPRQEDRRPSRDEEDDADDEQQTRRTLHVRYRIAS